MHGGVDAIKPYVDEFIEFAKTRPDLTFLVTRVGCGIAGFTNEGLLFFVVAVYDLEREVYLLLDFGINQLTSCL